MPDSGGKALKRAIHVARAKAGIASDVQLALQAPVSYDTLMNWYSDATVPRGAELKKVAKALGVSLWDLKAAYDGTAPEPPPLQDVVADLISILGPLVEQATDGIEARLRAVEAELALRAQRVDGAHEGRSVPDGTAGSGTSG